MSNRLEVTLFGTQYSVGVLRLSREMIKVAMKVYGPKQWSQHVNDIALLDTSGKLASEIGHTIGHSIKTVYRGTGIAMQGFGFGMEVFHCGEFCPVDVVGSKNRTVLPSELMTDYKPNDMIGIFWAKREGAMFFRWDDVDDFDKEDLVLTYEDLGTLLARKRPFEIALDVTWQGQKGRRIEPSFSGSFETLKHLFHIVE